MKKIVSKLVAVSVIFAMAGSVARWDPHYGKEIYRKNVSAQVLTEQVFNA
ncbi:MAG: hypothetical protein K6D38_02945 [Pseudobutyrivibrio sp.]|nr:hypothetical protein [Pseudobutyrivibrio sp.]